MRGEIPPLPNTPSWRGAQLKKSTGTALPLPFTFICLSDKLILCVVLLHEFDLIRKPHVSTYRMHFLIKKMFYALPSAI
jgi:hypothetical protein